MFMHWISIQNNEGEQTVFTWNNIDASYKYKTGQNKPYTKECGLYGSFNINLRNR